MESFNTKIFKNLVLRRDTKLGQSSDPIFDPNNFMGIYKFKITKNLETRIYQKNARYNYVIFCV